MRVKLINNRTSNNRKTRRIAEGKRSKKLTGTCRGVAKSTSKLLISTSVSTDKTKL